MKRTETKTISIEMKAVDLIQLIRTNYADCGSIPDDADVIFYRSSVFVKWTPPVAAIESVAQATETLAIAPTFGMATVATEVYKYVSNSNQRCTHAVYFNNLCFLHY